MLRLKLRRTKFESDRTLGELDLVDPVGFTFRQGVTLELPWRNNEKLYSCIPNGKYVWYWMTHKKFGECISIPYVKGRDGILAHVGNRPDETFGCILIGKSFLHTEEGVVLSQSKLAFQSLKKTLVFYDDFSGILEIVGGSCDLYRIRKTEGDGGRDASTHGPEESGDEEVREQESPEETPEGT